MPEHAKALRPSALPLGGPAVSGPAPQRLDAPAVARRKVIVTIGIDFGTSSTKVFLRSDEPRATPSVCVFAENPVGYPPIALPSTVRVADSKVYFAAEAERRFEGTVYRSFKTCLLCNQTKQYCAHCGVGQVRVPPGHRMLPEGQGTVPPDELAAWYLAHVIGEVNKRAWAGNGEDIRLMYNMAAPLVGIRSVAPLVGIPPTSGRNYYERVLFIAEKLAQIGVAHQEVDLESLRFHYHQLQTDNPEIPSEADRTTFVVAETRAGMVAYGNSREMAVPGLHALIDIGAGTTDVSIFRLGGDSIVEHRPPDFYAANVFLVGADHVDEFVLNDFLAREPAKGLGGLTRPDWLGRIRIAKQEDTDGKEARRQMNDVITSDMYERASARVGSELFDQYKKVFGDAYQNEPRVDRWQQMRMFLIGGGSSLDGVASAFANSPWPPHVQPPELLPLNLPDNIACNGNDSTGDCIARYERLLMVAYGLSFPYATIDTYGFPEAVDVLPSREVRWKPDWDIGPFDPGS